VVLQVQGPNRRSAYRVAGWLSDQRLELAAPGDGWSNLIETVATTGGRASARFNVILHGGIEAA